jgi:hypothetical protein
LTVAWAKKYEVPLEKLFSKVSYISIAAESGSSLTGIISQTLIQKFPWAIAEIESDPDWKF